MSPRTRAPVILAVTSILLLSCVAGAAFAVYPLLPLHHAQAQARWQRQGIRHYEADVSWASDWNFGHVRVEVLDNRVVRGIDLSTGQPLDRVRLIRAGYFVSVDQLFTMLGEQMRPSTRWRYQLARYHPLLAHWFDRCAALLPRVSYDAQLGYPTSIAYRGTPCTNGANIRLKIARLRPLP